MKLEAVDRKNPHFICPATIGEVRGSEVLITFDGWRGAFDYWCRYDSRDIFPVGWCSLTGDNLQPPGTKGKAHIVASLSSSSTQLSKGSKTGRGQQQGHLGALSAASCVVKVQKIIPISSVTAWHQGAKEQLSIKMDKMMARWRDGAVQHC